MDILLARECCNNNFHCQLAVTEAIIEYKEGSGGYNCESLLVNLQ